MVGRGTHSQEACLDMAVMTTFRQGTLLSPCRETSLDPGKIESVILQVPGG